MTVQDLRAKSPDGVLHPSDWRGRIFSNGWQKAGAGTLSVEEPATGLVLTEVGLADEGDVSAAAITADQAQVKWAALAPEERARVFRNAARIFEEHAAEFSPWIMRETGAVGPKADFELQMAAGILNKAAAMPGEPQGHVLPSSGGQISLARRIPHGVVGVISPFNFPLILSIRAVAPALATGNAVILKPDPRTPVSGGYLIARVLQMAGLPEGLLSVLPGGGEIGEQMCRDPRIPMICFTGSTLAGRRVGELAGKHLKKVLLELGGKNALIVLEDADLDIAASNIAWGAYLHQGQICMTAGRILVHREIARPLTERLAAKAGHLPVGDPMSGQVALGPLISRRQVDRVHEIVTDTVKAGARLEAGGTFERLFYKPTVLSGVKPGMRAFDEEIFGPVVALTTFGNDDEAVELANRTEYGLSAGVLSQSVGRALAIGNRLNVGLLHINDQTVGDEPAVPFGGRGASGNGDRIGGHTNWDAFTQWQWVTIKDKATPYPF